MNPDNESPAMTPPRHPKVSVCVSAYNQEKYIGDCLQSLVDQTFSEPYEIVVSDDRSTDRTAAIMNGFRDAHPDRIRVIENTVNKGPFGNYLTVHSAARGEYVAHMDGDDLAFPNKLQTQVRYLDEHPDCNVSWHRMRFFDESNEMEHPALNAEFVDRRYYLADMYLLGPIGPHSSTMYRRKFFDINRFMGKCDDWFMAILYTRDGYGYMLKDVLGGYRIHHDSMSSGCRPTKKNRELTSASQLMAITIDPAARRGVAMRALANFVRDVSHLRSYSLLSLRVVLRCRTVPQLLGLTRLKRFFYWSRLPAIFQDQATPKR
jgi:glycosyltransferase involved in cell wall biosynthesis